MNLLSFAEENYLKAIFHLSSSGQKQVNTNAIAERLGIQVKTVRNHVSNICTKLQVADRTEAILRILNKWNYLKRGAHTLQSVIYQAIKQNNIDGSSLRGSGWHVC